MPQLPSVSYQPSTVPCQHNCPAGIRGMLHHASQSILNGRHMFVHLCTLRPAPPHGSRQSAPRRPHRTRKRCRLPYQSLSPLHLGRAWRTQPIAGCSLPSRWPAAPCQPHSRPGRSTRRSTPVRARRARPCSPELAVLGTEPAGCDPSGCRRSNRQIRRRPVRKIGHHSLSLACGHLSHQSDARTSTQRHHVGVPTPGREKGSADWRVAHGNPCQMAEPVGGRSAGEMR